MKFFTSMILILMLASTAHAHKLSVFAFVKGQKIAGEAYFMDGAPCKNCRLEATDAATGEILHEDATDANGKFSFDIPGMSAINVVVDSEGGHRGEYIVTDDEIRGASVSSSVQSDMATEKAPEQRPPLSSETGISAGTPKQPQECIVPNSTNIEAIVESAVDRKIGHIENMLIEMRKESSRPGITEILGGIGYIIGLVGLAAYLKYGRRGGGGDAP